MEPHVPVGPALSVFGDGVRNPWEAGVSVWSLTVSHLAAGKRKERLPRPQSCPQSTLPALCPSSLRCEAPPIPRILPHLSPGACLTSPCLLQLPPKRDETALQEEEELQLALALSQSEAEEKERMVSHGAL